jgi:hypothetical protein
MLPGWRSGKTLLFSFMAYRSPGEVLAGFDTRLDTPPISLRHHPFSRIAPPPSSAGLPTGKSCEDSWVVAKMGQVSVCAIIFHFISS